MRPSPSVLGWPAPPPRAAAGSIASYCWLSHTQTVAGTATRTTFPPPVGTMVRVHFVEVVSALTSWLWDNDGAALATLCDHVTVVVEVRPDKEMRRGDAGGDIAAMTDQQAVRNSPPVEFIGNAVSASSSASHLDYAIPLWAPRVRPEVAPLSSGGRRERLQRAFAQLHPARPCSHLSDWRWMRKLCSRMSGPNQWWRGLVRR